MRAIVLVPDRSYPYAYDWAYDVEARALGQGGIDVEARPWTEIGNLEGADMVLPLVAWGYHLDLPQWHQLLDRLETSDVPTVNPVSVLRWNSDKRYLSELSGAGIGTVPTISADRLDEAVLAQARERFGERLVVKPQVSAAADGTFRIDASEPIPSQARDRPMLVQPFVQSVALEGEYSLLLFGGKFSHALVKTPKAGDYRVQPHLGGRETACDPPVGAIALAQAALAAAPGKTAYARVDLIRLDDGSLAVMELELVEPSLWLDLAPDGGASFVAAIREALK